MTETLTYRRALAEARRTYDAIYTGVSGDLDAEERPRVERIYRIGQAAFAEQVPSDTPMSKDAAAAFKAHMRAATAGDSDAKLAWLGMMPRVVGELAPVAEPQYVLGPMIRATTYELALGKVLDSWHFVSEPVTVRFTIGSADWEVVYPVKHTVRTSRWLSFANLWWWTKPRTEEPTEAANQQSTLALAA